MITIRSASTADAWDLAEVHVATWQQAYAGLLPQPMLDGLSVARRAAGWEERLATDSPRTLVATADPDRRVVGFVSVGPSRDDDGATAGELWAVYVHPDHWDTGVGGRLHDAGMELLAREYEQATLWVLESNTRARSFYERRGWRPDGETKEDPREDAVLSEVRYRLALARPTSPTT